MNELTNMYNITFYHNEKVKQWDDNRSLTEICIAFKKYVNNLKNAK